MTLPNTYYIIILALIFIFVLYVIYKFKSGKKVEVKEDSKRLIRYSGLFRHATGLNIGNDKVSKLFHARPWLGNDTDSGMGECLGALKLENDKSLEIKFPKDNFGIIHEVNVFKYPSWEKLSDTLFNCDEVNIGYTKYDDIPISKSNEEIIVIITGIQDQQNEELVNLWLENTKVSVVEAPFKNFNKEKIIPKIDDHEYLETADSMYEEFSNNWLNSLPCKYSETCNVISDKSDKDSVFPPTSGIVETLTYIPSSLTEKILIVYPNRNMTLKTNSSFYMEINNHRTYFENEQNSPLNFVVLNVENLHTIHFEERFFVSDESKTLPFYIYVFDK